MIIICFNSLCFIICCYKLLYSTCLYFNFRTYNYSIDYDKNYTVNLEVGDYVVYENINLLPVQGLTRVDQEKVFIKDAEFYHSDIKYPEEKIFSL